jgi:hypothetical protein
MGSDAASTCEPSNDQQLELRLTSLTSNVHFDRPEVVVLDDGASEVEVEEGASVSIIVVQG